MRKKNNNPKALKVGLAQIAPIWLDKIRTINKIKKFIQEAIKEGCDLIVFGEAILPGYPYWLSYTGGASFNSQIQKEIHAHYIEESVNIEEGDLSSICKLAKRYQIAIYLGTVERAKNRGGHSLYCTLVFIDKNGTIGSAHRKLQPTYEERLCWSIGDGHGLQVHDLGLSNWEG